MFNPTAEFTGFEPDVRTAVIAASAALRRTGVVALYRPLLFAARLAYPHDGAFYRDLVEACETYSARVFVIEQRRANAGEGKLLRLAHDLASGRRKPPATLEAFYGELVKYAPDAGLSKTLNDVSIDWYHRRGHKYFLYEYERHLRDHPELLPALADFTDQSKEQRTTEHVLPQHPHADERGDCWRKDFTDDERVVLLDALGNLALTYDNSSYGAKCFTAKRGHPALAGQAAFRCYAQAELHQEQELAQYEAWTPATIAERQSKLASWAMIRWNVPASLAPAALSEEHDEIEAEPEVTGDLGAAVG